MWRELKEKFTPDLRKEISAFANTIGGTIRVPENLTTYSFAECSRVCARGSDERFAPVLALFDHHNYREITRADVEEVLGVGTTQAVNTLRDMLDEELIRKVGNGRLTRYV